MKPLAVLAAFACLITPAAAFDNDPASFRADPQAWVRNTLMPTCKAPAADMVALCDCMVPMIASRTTEADVAAVNNPAAIERAYARFAGGVAAVCMFRK
jgi:hypothetical protein